MAKSVISPAEGAELRRLYAEYPVASKRAAEALQTNGKPLGGAALERLLQEEAKVAAIAKRIREILGIVDEPL
jgi:hypothetical protein